MYKLYKLQLLQPKINVINDLIEAYFSSNPNETTTTARKLEEFGHRLGYRISQKTIRETLRELDKLGELPRIPHVSPQRKKISTYWVFLKDKLFQGIQ